MDINHNDGHIETLYLNKINVNIQGSMIDNKCVIFHWIHNFECVVCKWIFID